MNDHEEPASVAQRRGRYRADTEQSAVRFSRQPIVTPAGVPWAAVLVFIVIAFALAWAVSLPIWLQGGPDAPNLPVLIALIGMVMMYTPAIATLVVVFAMKSPPRERLRFLGMWPLRPARRVVWFSVLAIFAPTVVVMLIALVSSALGLVRLDFVHFSGFEALLAEQLGGLDTSATPLMPLPPTGLLVAMQIALIPLGALVNSIFAFGEEIGWRGWLLPTLRPLGYWPALVLSGVIWGLWHSPLILLGYNFGYTDWRGVALMTGGCIAWGVLLGWARLRSGSVWPAVIGHGSLNAAAGLVVLFAAAGAEVDMGVVGPLGFVAWGVIAVIVVIIALLGQLRQEPALAARVPRRGHGEIGES